MFCIFIHNFLINISVVMSMMIFMLVGVGFFTLLERKSLSYIQDRKGPNKLGISGILQPMGDGLKLFSKELFILKVNNYIWFYFSSLGTLFLCFISWLVMPFVASINSMNYGILYLFCCLSLISYFIMIVGWSSNSIYSNLGAMRSVAQIISYEISMILIILSCLVLVEGFNLNFFFRFQSNFILLFLLSPISLMFFVSILAELNRTPFDLIEGESELVSGFNTEYYSSLFSLIFLSEYGMIVLFSCIFIFVFLGSGLYSFFGLMLVMSLIILIILLRGVLPRIRYDELMYLCWKVFLPIALFYLFYVFNFKSLFMVILY